MSGYFILGEKDAAGRKNVKRDSQQNLSAILIKSIMLVGNR
jgi:hypothetical protein